MLIESNRIYLRAFEIADAPFMNQLNSNPNVIRYTGDGPFKNLEAAASFITNYDDYRKNNCGRWAVIRKEDGKWLGWCGLKKSPTFIDLGFRFFEDEWGKGYATEASLLSLEYGFEHLGFEEIIARAVGENSASIHVIQKLQMEFWKIEADEYFENLHHYKLHIKKWKEVKESLSRFQSK